MRSILHIRKGSKETKQISALMVKEEVTSSNEISEKVKPLLETLKELFTTSYRKDYCL